jgi:dihydrofolate reductase
VLAKLANGGIEDRLLGLGGSAKKSRPRHGFSRRDHLVYTTGLTQVQTILYHAAAPGFSDPTCRARDLGLQHSKRPCRSARGWFVVCSEGTRKEIAMRKLIVSEFVTLDGVMQAPGGEDEDTDGGFRHGGWTRPYWHDEIGETFGSFMKDVDALLLGRRTYVTHAEAFEPLPVDQDPFGTAKKYVVSRTLEKPIWRDTTIIRDNVVDAVRKLKASEGKNILTDGSSQLVHALLEHDLVDELHLLVYPIAVGKGKRVFSDRSTTRFALEQVKQYPTGVVGLHYTRAR